MLSQMYLHCIDNFYVPSSKGYEAAMQCQEENWMLRLQSWFYPFTFPMTEPAHSREDSMPQSNLSCDTHRCFSNWWTSPQSCSAPTGRNAPQTCLMKCCDEGLDSAELLSGQCWLSWSAPHIILARPGAHTDSHDTWHLVTHGEMII